MELDRIKEAGDVLHKVLSRYPYKVESWRLAVWYALQQGDYLGAAASKEIVRQFEPQEQKHMEDLSRLYLLAGVPAESARFFKKTIGPKPTMEENNHLIDIYLSGKMYEQALEKTRELPSKNYTPEHWESLGDIYYALHLYDDSFAAYEKAAALSDGAHMLLKTAYAAMKGDNLQSAVHFFKQIINQGNGEKELVESSVQNFTYIKKLQEIHASIN